MQCPSQPGPAAQPLGTEHPSLDPTQETAPLQQGSELSPGRNFMESDGSDYNGTSSEEGSMVEKPVGQAADNETPRDDVPADSEDQPIQPISTGVSIQHSTPSTLSRREGTARER